MKDLATVMILQRRLNSIQRDLGPLEDKVLSLMSAYKVSLPLFMHFLKNKLGDLFENHNNHFTPLGIIYLILSTCMLDYVMTSEENGRFV